MWVVAVAGIIGALTTFVISFLPPAHMHVGDVWHYELMLIVGLILMSLPPFLLRGCGSHSREAPPTRV